jgi:hypothetical protein
VLFRRPAHAGARKPLVKGLVAGVAAAVVAGGVVLAVVLPAGSAPPSGTGRGATSPSVGHLAPAPPASTTTDPSVMTTTVPVAPLALAGCPAPAVPPNTPPPPPPPSHPSVLVPESALPAPPAPSPPVTDLRAITGKGMWIWQWSHTEGGDADAVVARAKAAGLRQLWVRVADSFDGFYGAGELAALVPAAHHAGIDVIGWGFPYLYDPVGDAAWTRAAFDWRGPGGATLDGFSADIEMSTEGVALSPARVSVYLALARPAAAGRPFVGTVYPPTDRLWATYPYASIAPYVDAFAPMVYWGCDQPADDVVRALGRLSTLAPVAPVGQAFSTAGSPGQRTAAPSGAEIDRFVAVSRAGGAVGVSLWSWQAADTEEWAAFAGDPWPLTGARPRGGAMALRRSSD